MKNNEQCLYCDGCVVFEDEGERLSWCLKRKETIKDVNVFIGLSPSLRKYGLEGRPCWEFKPGKNKNVLEAWPLLSI